MRETESERERAKQKQRQDQHGVSSGLATFNTTVVHLSLSLFLSRWCARDTPRCRPLATLVIVAAAVLNFVVFHAHQTSSDNCCIYLNAVFLSCSPCFSSRLPGQVSSGLWSGSLCSLACRSVRLIGYEQLSDWFYWVAFVMCSGCLSLSLCLCLCLSLSFGLCCCCACHCGVLLACGSAVASMPFVRSGSQSHRPGLWLGLFILELVRFEAISVVRFISVFTVKFR